MEKEYIVIVHRGVDIDAFDAELSALTGDDCIPNREVTIANPRPGSKRMTHWMLTDQEAENLKNDPRVLSVEIPPEQRDDIQKGLIAWQNGNFYRGGDHYSGDQPLPQSSWRNWGLKRCIEETNSWGSDQTDASTLDEEKNNYNSSYDYSLDGSNVDIVIQDSGIEPNHPEWNDKNGNSRLQQINWYTASGLSGTQNANHYRDYNGHGTHVASTAAGKLYGFAKGAHIYSQKLSGLEGSSDSGTGISEADAFDAIRLWHNKKNDPLDPAYTGRPTVVNMSWGYFSYFSGAPTNGTYRGSSWDYQTDYLDQGKDRYDLWEETGLTGIYGDGPTYLPTRNTVVDAEIEDMIDDGIIVVIAAGNDWIKIDLPTGPDYNNSVVANGSLRYYHRGSSPYSLEALNVSSIDVRRISTDNGVTWQEFPSYFSNVGPGCDIFAPGHNIVAATSTTTEFNSKYVSSYPDNVSYKIANISGTSMASPQVAGVAALYLQSKPNLSPAELKQILIDNSKSEMYDTGLDNDYFNSTPTSTSPNGKVTKSLMGQTNRILFSKYGQKEPMKFSGVDGLSNLHKVILQEQETYLLSSTALSIQEDNSFTITLATTNVGYGQSIPYTITGISSSDINGASLTGNFVVGISNSVTFNVPDDATYEGNETFTLSLDNGEDSINVIFSDANATYSLSTTSTNVNEGDTFTITLATTNVPNGGNVPYTITGVNSNDINGASLTGNFVVGTVDSIVFTISNDLVTEGTETFILSLNNGSTSIGITINDTSTSPVGGNSDPANAIKLTVQPSSSNLIVYLGLNGANNDTMYIDWGDGSGVDQITGIGALALYSHTYTAGTYTVKLYGDIVHFGSIQSPYSRFVADRTNITACTSFGNLTTLTSINNAFLQCTNLASLPTSLPSTITDISYLFADITGFNITSILNWNTSNVTNMSGVFTSCNSWNENMNGWDFSNVTNMAGMFQYAYAFNNGDVAGGQNNPINWDVSNVTDFSGCFQADGLSYQSSFNQDITSWDMTNVTSIANMMRGNPYFNQDVSGWNITSTCTRLNGTFDYCTSFNQDVSLWDVSNVTHMTQMFRNTLFNQNISNWNTSSNGTMFEMFRNTPFNQNIGSWDVSNVTTFTNCFIGCSNFNNGDTAGSSNNPLNWTTTAATWMNGLFENCSSFNQSIPNFNTSSVTIIQNIFKGCSAFNQNISHFNLNNVTNASYMFYNATVFNNGEIAGSYTTPITSNLNNLSNASFMFLGANAFGQNITNISQAPLTDTSYMFSNSKYNGSEASNMNVSGVTNMSRMFGSNTEFNQDLSSWDTSNVTNMSQMFYGGTTTPPAFNGNITTWDTSSVTNMSQMFYRNAVFNQDIGNWNTSNVTNMDQMFKDATIFDQDLSGWNVLNIPSLPTDFATNSALRSSYYPVWGTSGSGGGSSTGNFNPNNAIVLTVDTTNNTSLVFSLSSSAVNNDNTCIIDWGDSQTSTVTPSLISLTGYSHTYSSSGTFTVRIYGNVRWFGSIDDPNYLYTNSRSNIIACTSFGNLTTLTSLRGAFRQCPNLTSVPNSLPATVVNLEYLFFEDTNSFNDSNVTLWDTSNVTGFEGCFYGFWSPTQGQTGPGIFNQDISSWNVSNATSLFGLLAFQADFNQDLSSWDVSNVTKFQKLFNGCTSFNQNMNAWNTSSATDLSYMFYDCIAYTNNNVDLVLDLTNVTTTNRMFYGCTNFNHIGTWNTSNITNMFAMFQSCENFNRDIGSWDTSNVANMSNMFYMAIKFNQDISLWDVSNVTNMHAMFGQSQNTWYDGDPEKLMTFNCGYGPGIANVGIGVWNTSSLVDTSDMFRSNYAFNSNLGGWDTRSLLNTSGMFSGQDLIDNGSGGTVYRDGVYTGDLSGWNTISIVDMTGMFGNQWKFTHDLSNWCVPNITTPAFSSSTCGCSAFPVWGTNPLNLNIPQNYNIDNAIVFEVDTTLDPNLAHIFNFQVAPHGIQILRTVDSSSGIVSTTVYINTENTSARRFTLTFFGAAAGTRTYYLYGDLEEFYFDDNDPTDRTLLTDIISFGNLNTLTSISTAGADAPNLTSVPSTLPTRITDISGMFRNSTTINDSNISSWNTNYVTNMDQLFSGATNFNQDLTNWCVDNIISEPVDFSLNSSLISTYKPVWGTCPFDLSTSSASVNEGGSFTITLSSGLANGTNVPYTITGVSSSDINGASLTGNFVVGTVDSITFNVNSDNLTEGIERFVLSLDNQPSAIFVSINDTSIDSTYSLSSSDFPMVEGNTTTITLTTNASNGTNVPYTITGVSSSAINGASLTGNFVVGTSDSVVINLLANTIVELGSTFVLRLDNNPEIQIAIPILDTSPRYSLFPNITNIDEGDSVTITLSTSNVPPGTTLPYTITGVSSSDINGASLTGNFVVGTVDSVTLTTTQDAALDGVETLVLTLDNTSTSTSVTINDTSGPVGGNTNPANAIVLTIDSSLGLDATIGLKSAMIDGNTECFIDWGDGTIDTLTPPTSSANNYTHTYATSNTFTVKIYGNVAQFGMSESGSINRPNIIACTSFGNLSTLTSLKKAFRKCTNLTSVTGTLHGLVTDLSYMFQDCTSFNNNSIGNWNTSKVTDMQYMFYGCTIFNQDISSWDVSNVIYMTGMFSNATTFNQDISSWDVSNARYMGSMFNLAKAFNMPIGSWNTSSLTNIWSMFSDAEAFNQNINSWDVSRCQWMYGIFRGCKAFNQPLNNWNTSSATQMQDMFNGAIVFNQDLSSWDTSNVTNMNQMFMNCNDFNWSLDTWDTTNVTNMGRMFWGCTYFNQSIGSWNTSNVTDMSLMFRDATTFNQPIGNWNTSNVTNMTNMFSGANAFNQPIGNWNTSNVTNMSYMLYAPSFDQDISSWNTTNVTNMSGLFYSATAFNQDISSWDTSNVTNMTSMFWYTTSFTQDLSSWCVTNIPSLPSNFATGSALLPAQYPVWGTCPP